MIALASTEGAAQLSANLTRPFVGYVFDDDSRALRPIYGVLGNATVGAAADLGFAPPWALMLDANHAIVSAGASSEALIVNLESNPIAKAPISGAPANPSRAAVSYQGTSAAFYYASAQQVILVTGLPQKPVVSQRFDLSRLDRPLTQLAVSNDGNLIVFAIAEEGTEAVYGWTPSWSDARFLAAAASVSGLVITGSGAAIVADRGADEVFAIWDVSGAAVRQSLAGVKEGVSSPAGVAVGKNNRIYVGNAGSATVTALDSDGRYSETYPCGCELSGVYPLRESVFRLTDRIDQTTFLLDTNSDEERILFVPPARN
jgi:hypothetical protein